MTQFIKRYTPTITKAVAWEVIEDRYADRASWGRKLTPLLALVRHIKASPLSQRLYAFTSLDKLVVSIYPDIEMRKEALHIVFDQHKQEWEFIYFAKPYQKPEFVRYYPAEAGLGKFEQFIKMIRW